MLNRINPTLLLILVAVFPLCAFAREAATPAGASRFSHARVLLNAANDREQDGLSGPVRRVRTETAKITTKNARPVEGPRVLLETATYDIKGAKVDNAYFLAAGGTLTGKEVYKYDDKGNIVEMTMHNADGSLMSKEVYSYEFDSFGNWTKMITSVAVIEGGKMSFEPTEVTYRTFSYFLDEATMAKMSQPAAAPAANNNTANAGAPAAANSSSSPSAPPAATANNKANAAAAPAPLKSDAAASKSDAGKSEVGKAVKSESKMAAAPPPLASVDRSGVAASSTVVATRSNPSGVGGPVVVSEGEAPARPVARGPLKPVSGGILNGKAISLPQPFYPEMAKRARAAGLVTVEVVVDVTGRVISAKAVGGPPMLRAEAERAAMQARFSPTLLSGQPVRVSGQIGYNFTIN